MGLEMVEVCEVEALLGIERVVGAADRVFGVGIAAFRLKQHQAWHWRLTISETSNFQPEVGPLGVHGYKSRKKTKESQATTAFFVGIEWNFSESDHWSDIFCRCIFPCRMALKLWLLDPKSSSIEYMGVDGEAASQLLWHTTWKQSLWHVFQREVRNELLDLTQ